MRCAPQMLLHTTRRAFSAQPVQRQTAGSRSRDSSRHGTALLSSALAFAVGGTAVSFMLPSFESTPALMDDAKRREALRRRGEQQQRGGGSGNNKPSAFSSVNPWLVAGGVTFVSLLTFALTRYKRCSPNEVLVVFGQTGLRSGEPAKLVHG
jgi:hypothetical protein